MYRTGVREGVEEGFNSLFEMRSVTTVELGAFRGRSSFNSLFEMRILCCNSSFASINTVLFQFSI